MSPEPDRTGGNGGAPGEVASTGRSVEAGDRRVNGNRGRLPVGDRGERAIRTPKGTEKRAHRRAPREQEIRQAALRLFREKGYHATSIQDLARAVGLQKASLYYYFSTKEELLAGIAAEAITRYTGSLEQIATGPGSAREKLQAAIRNHLVTLAAHRDLVTIYLRDSYALTPEQQEPVRREGRRYVELFERIIREGIETGDFASEDPKMAALAVVGACNWFYTWFDEGGRLSPEAIAERFAATFLDGLAARR